MPKRSKSEIDRKIGLEWYITDTEGSGGRIRCRIEDFIVEEVLLDGTVLWSSNTGKNIELKSKVGGWYWIVIEKKKIDTISISIKISKTLNINIREITYAGLKDTVAIATQIFSIPAKVGIEDIKKIEDDRISIKAIVNMDRPFTSQELWGNRFTIVIRDVENLDIIHETVKQVQERGLPNYYGYQRFGIQRPNTHIVGKLIILRKFEDAIRELIGTPWFEEDEKIAKAREYFLKGDYAKALEYWPRSLRFLPERKVIEHLYKNPRDHVGALRKLPPDLLKLYIESYQSYLFNKLLSMRIEYGLSIKYVDVGDIAVLLDHNKLPTRHIVYISSESLKDRVNEQIDRGRMCLVLPVPGYGTRILSGKQYDILKRLLKDEGISLEMFKLDEIPEADCPGTIRQASINPIIENLEIDRDSKCVKIVFRLVRGSYATVLIREIIKPEDPLKAGF